MEETATKLRPAFVVQPAMVVACFTVLGACKATIGDDQVMGGGNNGDGTSEVPDAVGVTRTDPCFSPAQSFAWEMYGAVFSRCVGCHNDFGLARDENVALRLRFPGEPEFAELNVQTLMPYAQRTAQVDGRSLPLLLAKPTGQTAHVGGAVIPPDSPEARLLASFVDKLADPPTCTEAPDDAAAVILDQLVLASPKQTYARAKFMLTGEVALPEELEPLPDTDAMLDEQLDALMATDGFLRRAQEMFADWLLTDAYSMEVRGNDLLPQLRHFPRRNYFQPLCTPERNFRCCNPDAEACCAIEREPSLCSATVTNAAVDAVAREPLELLKHVVRNDLPLTELVTADYGVVNPYSALIYGFTDDHMAELFDADPSNDAQEFKPVALPSTPLNNLQLGAEPAYPHAGVLSMPSIMVRYPSSTSNQQRTRASRLVLERMLAIPVMKLSNFTTATLPDDADLELATQEYPACTVCHAAIDPIAGHFRNFGNTGQYRPDRRMPDHLPDASFLSGRQEPEDGMDPVRWLGAKIAREERFALGVLMPVLADLIGTEVLSPPSDVRVADYPARYLAFRLQQLEIQRLRRVLVGTAGLRLKPLVKAVVKGPFFRAVGAPDVASPMREALAIAGVGPGALLTPEQMARKIESVTGLTYRVRSNPTGRDMFRSFREYRLMFGGTDWDATPERYREASAMTVRIALRMANEVACLAVPQDFARIERAQRRLLPNVETTMTPEAGDEAQIRTELRRLHLLLLGEDLPEGHAELDATYQLWTASRQALQDAGRAAGTRLPSRCRATASFETVPAEYPNETHRVVDEDPDYTVRAWMAVVAYLLADGRFFLQ